MRTVEGERNSRIEIESQSALEVAFPVNTGSNIPSIIKKEALPFSDVMHQILKCKYSQSTLKLEEVHRLLTWYIPNRLWK